MSGDAVDEARPAVRAQLSSELQGLSGPSRKIWEDPAERRRLIGELLGVDAGRATAALAEIDAAVQEALELAGLSRGPVAGVVPVRGRAYAGRKLANCTLEMNLDAMGRQSTLDRGSDTTMRTWVHESIHARHVYADDHATEYRSWAGYEEGLAEGLARLVVRGRAGLDPTESYDYFVSAYETLSVAAGIDEEGLLRALWLQPAGRVRQGLVQAIDAGRRARSLPPLTEAQRGNLARIADLHFASDRAIRTPDRGAMLRLWRGGLR